MRVTPASRREPGASAAATAGERPMLANSLALIAGKFATMGLGFASWVVAARLFSQGDVGFASAVVSAMMLVVQIALFGTGSAVISLYASSRSNLKALLDTSISFVILLSLGVALLAALLFQVAFDDLARVFTKPGYLFAFLIMSVAGTLGVLFDQISTVTRRGDQVMVRGAISGIVTLAAVALLALALGRTSPGPILIAWAAGNAVPIAIAAMQVRRSIPGYRYAATVERDLLGSMTRVGWPNWLLTLAERLPGTVLPIVALELLSAEANASWYTAWMMAWVVYVVPIQIGINLFAESARGEHGLPSIVRSGVVSSLALGVPAAVCAGVLAPYILRILGPEYADTATAPLRILLIAVIPFTVLQAYFAICRSRMRFREGIATCVVASGGGILTAALVAGEHGLTGMAWAWLGTQTLVCGWALWRLRMMLARESGTEVEAVATASF